MAIVHQEGELRAKNGDALYYVCEFPEEGVKVVLGMLHGYADHMGRYGHVMSRLAARGVACIGLDMRGHGRAGGLRGGCNSFGEYLGDADELRKLVDDRYPNVPAVLFGHSFGGLVAATSAIENPGRWRGLVLSAPFVGLSLDIPRYKEIAASFFSFVWPGMPIPHGLTGDLVSRDPERLLAYEQDRYCFSAARARWVVETKLAQKRLIENASRLKIPLLTLFGTDDRIAKLAAAREFYDRAGGSDKTWRALDGVRHEPWNDLGWEGVVDAIADWAIGHAT